MSLFSLRIRFTLFSLVQHILFSCAALVRKQQQVRRGDKILIAICDCLVQHEISLTDAADASLGGASSWACCQRIAEGDSPAPRQKEGRGSRQALFPEGTAAARECMMQRRMHGWGK